ncbi:MAG: glycoside hydrolase family 32 protein [Sphingobacteriaceae bacterium]|jgi:hypothetical protein|nr:glycoside hydrolase family 32 protein [Sphingobacteriaceae bacterium]
MKSPGNTIAVLFLLLAISGCAVRNSSGTSNIEVKKIWDAAPHNAFTDLIRFKGNFYCSFREGLSHVSGPNGSVRILKSGNGKDWQSVASFKLDQMDARDPKLSITPDNRLMVLIDGETYKDRKVDTRKPYVSYSADGNNFSNPEPATVDPNIAVKSDWVWRVTWHEGVGYAIDYQPGALYLLKTTDGKYFGNVSKIPVDGNPNESTIRFDKNSKMYVLIRREADDKNGALATSEAPYTSWNFSKMDKRLGGPNFIFLNDTTLCIGTRMFETQDKTVKPFTGIYITDLQGRIQKTLKLPSGGDTSYPGMLIYKNKLWFSYYSSHEGKTSIYLAKVPLSALKN